MVDRYGLDIGYPRNLHHHGAPADFVQDFLAVCMFPFAAKVILIPASVCFCQARKADHAFAERVKELKDSPLIDRAGRVENPTLPLIEIKPE